MVNNWEICMVINDKGGGRNRILDRAKFINMDSLSGDFGLNVLAQIVGSNFNDVSFGWLNFSLIKIYTKWKLRCWALLGKT